jgi:IS5 family transposase
LQNETEENAAYNTNGWVRVELTHLVSPKHPLAKLAHQIDWKSFEEKFGASFAEAGRPAVATRLMVSLHYLKYTFDLSDEDVVARWVENPYWQYLSGRQYFEYQFPIDPSSMTRWRNRVGDDGAEELLKQTIQTAMKCGYLKKQDCARVNVDTTVQTKAIRFPTDARLYDRMREVLVRAADKNGIELRQNYERVGKVALRRQQGYGHGKKFKRANKETKRLKTFLGRVVRDIERKAVQPDEQLTGVLSTARRILTQERDSKNKIYSVHEPQVECIAKGKANKRYEFGNKAGLVTSAKRNWILGALGFNGNPYDGHTLGSSLTQAEKLTTITIDQATCDLGYRGHNVTGKNILIVPRDKRKGTAPMKLWWRRRNAIEPIIGHEKSDHRLERNRLAGEFGDRVNVLLSACGFNFKKPWRAFCALLQERILCLNSVGNGFGQLAISL